MIKEKLNNYFNFTVSNFGKNIAEGAGAGLLIDYFTSNAVAIISGSSAGYNNSAFFIGFALYIVMDAYAVNREHYKIPAPK